MAFNSILCIVGLALAILTLMDVFDTVIVPGGSKASLRVAQRLSRILLPVWKAVRGRRHGLSGAFAPLVLVLCFVVWMALLAFGFGLMAFAARSDFQPPLRGIFDGIYIVGSSLVTVGLSQSNPTGLARWVVLGAGFCGLAVMTMAVTYLLEVQGSVAQRDIGIIKLNTTAGEPPSAVTLLQRFAALANCDELREVLRDGRNWCALVRQSHSNHPSLIYFQSVSAGGGWPGALGAFLDLALLAEHVLDERPLLGPAVLLREEGTRMARELAMVVGLKPKKAAPDESELRQAAEQLRGAGYTLREDTNFSIVAEQRCIYRSCVDALAEHLGKPSAVLVRQE